MPINDLPDEVLLPVLRMVLPAIMHRIAYAKAGLELLAVCRRWRMAALPAVYDTVFIKCGTERLSEYMPYTPGDASSEEPENVDIATTLDLVVGARCLRAVRRVVVDVFHYGNVFPGLKAVLARLQVATGEWAGVRKLELSLHEDIRYLRGRRPLAADNEDDIGTVSSGFAVLIFGLREITLSNDAESQAVGVLFGKLAGFYANQLEVLRSLHLPIVPQGLAFPRLRVLNIKCLYLEAPDFQLPQLNPAVVENLVLAGLMPNDMWSMFSADGDGHAITFPRLANIDVEHRKRYLLPAGQPTDEQPWALQFPAAKRVRIVCDHEQCPSMENAVFPACMESLEVAAGVGVLQAISNAKVQVYGNLFLDDVYLTGGNSAPAEIANRILTAAGPGRCRRLMIGNLRSIPLELFAYTGLTHLKCSAPTTPDDMMEHIRRQPRLVGLLIDNLRVTDSQTDFSIPECADHEPVAPLDTQVKRLLIHIGGTQSPEQAIPILRFLMLKIRTLVAISASQVTPHPLQAFIDDYVQWYPHLANIELTTA